MYSDCGSEDGKGVRIRASVCSYRFIEYCLYKDLRTFPPVDHAFTIINSENAITGDVESFVAPDVLDESGVIKIAGGTKYRLINAQKKYDNIYEYLGFSEEEAADFNKWYSRRVKPYCRERGIHTDEYPITPPLLLEIAKHKTADLESVIDYFEGYCRCGLHVSVDFVKEVADMFVVKKSAVDHLILKTVLDAYPEKLAEYRAGKAGLANMFFGEYLKRLTDKTIDKNSLREELIAALSV